MSRSVWVVTIVALLSLVQVQVLAQALPYGPYGVPVAYNNDDDDLGMLLAILLLVTRNKGCNCCNCCNSVQNIPIPYPIPIPTNNPVIFNGCQNDEDPEDKPKVKVNKGDEGTTIDVDVTDVDVNKQ